MNDKQRADARDWLLRTIDKALEAEDVQANHRRETEEIPESEYLAKGLRVPVGIERRFTGKNELLITWTQANLAGAAS